MGDCSMDRCNLYSCESKFNGEGTGKSTGWGQAAETVYRLVQLETVTPESGVLPDRVFTVNDD